MIHPGSTWQRFAICLLVPLFFFATGQEPKADEKQVSIEIALPSHLEDTEKKDLKDLKRNIFEAFSDALKEPYVVREGEVKASDDYHVTLHIRQPTGCIWPVRCTWSKRGDEQSNMCWETTANVKFCRASNDELSKNISDIQCLGRVLNFKAVDAPRIRSNLCELEEAPTTVKKKGIYTACLDIGLADDQWTTKIRFSSLGIPVLLARELQEDFGALGYVIVPESDCQAPAQEPVDVALVFEGQVLGSTQGSRIYVSVNVRDGRRMPPEDIMKELMGPTPSIDREDYEDLGAKLIEYIKGRIKKP